MATINKPYINPDGLKLIWDLIQQYVTDRYNKLASMLSTEEVARIAGDTELLELIKEKANPYQPGDHIEITEDFVINVIDVVSNNDFNEAVRILNEKDANMQRWLDDINEVLPPEATIDNKLVSSSTLAEAILNNGCRYLSTKDNRPFATFADLCNGPYYHDESEVEPTQNDYAVVDDDEQQAHACSRYYYTKNGWNLQYIVSSKPFDDEQMAAINSGWTAELTNEYKVKSPEWDNKQSALTFDTTPTDGSTNPVTSNGIKEYVDTGDGNLGDRIDILDAETPDWNEIDDSKHGFIKNKPMTISDLEIEALFID